MIDMDRLERAREARGQTVDEACHEIGISAAHWYNLKRGTVAKPGRLVRVAIEKYIQAAEGK